MPQVDLRNILTEEEALQRIQDIFTQVATTKDTVVVTKGGRPVLAIVDVALLEGTPEPQPNPIMPVAPPPAPAVELPHPDNVPPASSLELPPLEVPEMPAPAAPIANNELPEMPEDPRNSSPLA